MCYSATVRAEFAAFRRLFPKSRLSIKDFFDLYLRRKMNRPGNGGGYVVKVIASTEARFIA